LIEYIPRIECANCTKNPNGNFTYIGVLRIVNGINEITYKCPKGLSCDVVEQVKENSKKRKKSNF